MSSKYLLPQNDSDSRRESKLEAWQSDFFFQHEHGYPMANKPPLSNLPAFSYDVDMIKILLKSRANIKDTASNSGLKFTKDIPHVSTKGVSKLLVQRDITPLINYFLPDLGPVLPNGRPSTVADYAKVFYRAELPANAKDYDSDAAFAYTFVAGADPDMLRRMTSIPPQFPITSAHFKATKEFAADDLTSAMREGRVYYVDYSVMKTLKNGVHPQGPKYMYAPFAAFAIPRGAAAMVPFAIQTGPDAAGREIYTPADGYSWKIARSTVQVAANAHSAIITHLSSTHLLIDPIALSTYRHLADNHPISALLRPHFTNTLHINFSAFKVLVGKDQFVDRMLGSDIESNYELIASNRLQYDFKAHYLPAKLAAHQTLERSPLALYPYRDDGLLLWNAIEKWITGLVSYYYPNEAVLRADFEIQAWAAEISAQKGGQVRNFAGNGGVTNIQELIQTLTMIIFTVGPQHAVVNYAQRTDMSYIPAAPMAGYTPEMKKGKGHTEQDWLKFLPPLDVANVQLTLCNLLGNVYYGKLGDYGSTFTDPVVAERLRAYQQNLVSIEATINDRNRTRRIFDHLLPSKVPQSINI